MEGRTKKLLALAAALLFAASQSAFAHKIALTSCSTAPITITTSGSCFLANNLGSTVGADCIDVTASNVTINLNGFTISGGTIGINASGQGGIRIEGGTVIGMTGNGVVVGDGSVVEGVRVVGSGGDGIDCGSDDRISGNDAAANSGYGVNCGLASEGSMVAGNVANSNFASGILVGRLGGVTDNVANGNGIKLADLHRDGITAGGADLVKSNEASANSGYGLAFISGASSGYAWNVLSYNLAGNVQGGVSMGAANTNLCNGSAC